MRMLMQLIEHFTRVYIYVVCDIKVCSPKVLTVEVLQYDDELSYYITIYGMQTYTDSAQCIYSCAYPVHVCVPQSTEMNMHVSP